MQLAAPGRPHLTYCTNIHPGESLEEVARAVREHVPRVKSRLGVTAAFGVGLRLSARAAEDLDAPGALEGFRDLLRAHGLYVFTVNGFPYGAFHGTRVKENVYRPDWREDARVGYSDRLARLLSRLLPDGVNGSISTVPGAFRARSTERESAPEIAERLFRHLETLHRVREETGKLVELALEPEPACFLETTDDTVRFFQEHVFARDAVTAFASRTGLSAGAAETFLRRHVGVCLDACHLAVEFEDARVAVDRFRAAGLRVGKIQITTALSLALTGEPSKDAPTLSALERFSDGVYLHQVVERAGEALTRFVDLPEALAAARARTSSSPSEWRVHFHVPVFAESVAPFASTQPFLRDLLDIVRREPVSEHLEVETYTWGVLPPEHRDGDVDVAITRELAFTLGRLGFASNGAVVP